MSFVCLLLGTFKISFLEVIKAIFNQSNDINNRVILNIRIPRVLASIICGAGLSVAGLIMQTTLSNEMATPSTLGVSSSCVLGANVSIIIFAGGFLSTGNNINNYINSINPFSTSLMAFIFAIISILLILGLCKIKSFSPTTVVLSGLALSSVWSSLTTLLQYFATDVGLSSALIWNFGDLGRATYQEDLMMFIVVSISSIIFFLLSWKYNALLSGDNVAKSLGINVSLLRFISLLLSSFSGSLVVSLLSLITALCVSFLGIIGFVGLICPHICKKIVGHDHRYLIPSSLLCGSLLLLISDTFSRINGSSLPVGAITSLIGAPFFLYMIFSKESINARN